MEDPKHDFDLIPKANPLLTKFDIFVLSYLFVLLI